MVHIMTTLPNTGNLTGAQKLYNPAHKCTHCSVERAIGVVKRQWNILRGMRYEPEKCCKIIAVYFLLNNMTCMLPLDDLPEEQIPPANIADPQLERHLGNEEARHRQQNIIEQYFNA